MRIKAKVSWSSPCHVSVIDVMVDPDGTLDALASLGLTTPTTPTRPTSAKTSPTSPGSAPPAKESLPEIPSGARGSAASSKSQTSSTSIEMNAQGVCVGLGLAGVGGLPFSRMRPSGEEAIAQKWAAPFQEHKQLLTGLKKVKVLSYQMLKKHNFFK